MNTNGVLLNIDTAKDLVNCGFDEILISLHAGTEETYQKLIGSNTFNKVVENIQTLSALKIQERKNKPEVGIAFALNKINAHEIKTVVDLAIKVKANYLNVTHYYDVRNRLGEDISFRNDPDMGNNYLSVLYFYAKTQGLKLNPEKPPYLNADENILYTEQNRCPCFAPWSTIKFEGCMEHPDSHYVTVCNRIVLFRIDYKEFDFDNFDALWNHPYLQYLRSTVNTQELNPICRFCKDKNTPVIRNIDNEKYRMNRDKATQAFFDEAKAFLNVGEIKGLYPLDKPPYI